MADVKLTRNQKQTSASKNNQQAAYTPKGFTDMMKAQRQKAREKSQLKKPTGRWYNGNSLLGNDWAMFYFLIGAGDTGKSYWTMKHILTAKYRSPQKYKLFWTRLTETACERLLSNNAAHLVDPDLYRKFGYELKRKGNTVFYGHTETRITKSGKEEHKFKIEGELCQVHPLSTFFNNKGEALFDNQYDGEYYVILDEMNREAGEANRFSIVDAFANQLENFVRDSKCRIRVICIGNNMEELSDVLSAFNFIPKAYGRYKLKRRKAIIDVIEPSEEYFEDRKQSAGYLLNPNAKRFTTVNVVDTSLTADQHAIRTRKPTYVLQFSKQQSKWYTLNEGNLISAYNGETKPRIGMAKYLDVPFNLDFTNSIIDRYNARQFTFDNYATYIRFTKDLSLLKR